MKLQGVDTVKEIVKWLISKATCILKSNKNFNKNYKVLSCCAFPDAALLPCFSTKLIGLEQFL